MLDRVYRELSGIALGSWKQKIPSKISFEGIDIVCGPK